MLFYNQPNAGTMNPTFTLCEKGALSGIHLLDPTITINSISVTPSLLYYSIDATASNWPARSGYGETLDIFGSTAPSLNQGSPLLGPYDDSVKFNRGGYYKSTTNFADVTTEDMVVEVVMKTHLSGAAQEMLGTFDGSDGWQIYQVGGGTTAPILYAGEAGTTDAFSVSAGNLVFDTWYHLIWFIDRSGSGVCYINGAQGTAVSVSAAAGSITTAGLFSIGARNNGQIPHDSNIAYAAMWKQDAWLDTHLQATVARERFFKLTGLYPQVAKGTALPLTATRNTAAYLPKTEANGDTHLYRIGASWLRVGNPVDSNGEQLVGYLAEPPATNKILWSENFNHEGSWTQQDTGDTWGTQLLDDGDMEVADTSYWTVGNNAILTKETTDPHGGSRYLRVAYNGTNNPGAYQSGVLTVGKTYTLSGWFRSDGVVNAYVYLGLVTGYAVVSTLSTSWQAFSITRKVVDTRIYLASIASGAGQYCEFDDLKLVELTETSPNQILNAFPLIADSTDGYHGFSQNVLLTAGLHTNSVYAKAGAQDWLYLGVEQATPLIIDGDMEVATTAAWTAANSATLTKETTTPHGGTQCLRVARSTANNPIGYQSCISIGKTYRITGWYRGDGSCAPGIYIGSFDTLTGIGTSSTSWQYFDLTKLSDGNYIGLRGVTSTGTQYAEFDDIEVTEVTPTDCYFDLTSGVVGTAQNGAVGSIENLGDGWYKCAITHTAIAKTYAHHIRVATADEDRTFAGDGSTVSMYFWGAQIETGELPTSYIPTTNATASRSADFLMYEGLANIGGVGSNLEGSVHFKFLTPDFTPATTRGLFNFVDSADPVNNAIYGSVTTINTTAFNSVASGGDAGGASVSAVDPTDGQIHSINAQWATDDFRVIVDSSSSGVDVAVDPPDALDNLRIGSTGSSNQLGGYLAEIKIYQKKY